MRGPNGIARMTGPGRIRRLDSTRRRIIASAAALAVALLLVWIIALVHGTLLRRGEAEALRLGQQRLAFLIAALQNATDRHDRLPRLLARERDFIAALKAPADAEAIARANRAAAFVSTHADVSDVFLIDEDGDTIAASNADQPDTFVGHNFAFRPYFADSIAGRTGRFYAVGAVTGVPGYFIAEPIEDGGKRLGVVVIKVSLAPLAELWTRSGDAIAAVDRSGVIMLASDAAWLYRTLAPLLPLEVARLKSARQYGDDDLKPLDAAAPIRLGEGSVKAELSLHGETGAYLVQARSLERLDWRLVLFTPLAEARRFADTWTSFAVVLLVAAGFGLALVAARSRNRADRRRAAERLARLKTELEAEIERAGAQLAERNRKLRDAERILTETRDEALQAGKLAALGQMAAGISHELNQPLTALSTLSDNAAALLERGDADSARRNLALIGATAIRMGRIVGQFKAFARKNAGPLEPVPVKAAISAAMIMVENRAREIGAAIVRDEAGPDPVVRADRVRLEQILVNLLRNALDASENAPTRHVEVGIRLDVGRPEAVLVEVRDHGAGIAPAALGHLFEPFFTTKPDGRGLGLGLALSQDIAKSFGGEILAANAPGGGAVFTLVLPRA